MAAITIVATLSTSCSGTKSLNSLATAANLSNLMSLVGSKPELSSLLSLVQVSGLGEMLGGSNLMTLLAPTNQAFSNLDASMLSNLLGDKMLQQIY